MPKVSSKNQITIPVEVLRETGVEPGDEVSIVSRDGEIVVVPQLSRIRRYAGRFTGVYEPGHLDELRDEWDR